MSVISNKSTIPRKLICSLLTTSLLAVIPSMDAATLTVAGINSMRTEIVGVLSTGSNLDPDSISKDLETFEQRIKRDGIQKAEAEKCYTTILENMSSATGDRNKSKLCAHLITQLAIPGRVNQGRRNTCALATLEYLLYRREPSVVCNTIFAAASGKLTDPSGIPIRLDPACLNPDRESNLFHPDGPYRSYASQIFQIASANLYWQSQRTDPRGISVPRGSVSYIQFDGRGYSSYDSGERLTIQWSNDVTEFVTGADNLPESSPSLTLDKIAAIYRLLAERRQADAPVLLCHKKRDNKKEVVSFASQAELSSILCRLKNASAFPAIISIKSMPGGLRDADGYTPRRQSQGRWHVICIDDFNSLTNEALIADFSTTSKNEMLNISELYSMACPTPAPLSNPAHITLPARPFLKL